MGTCVGEVVKGARAGEPVFELTDGNSVDKGALGGMEDGETEKPFGLGIRG